MTSAKMRAVLIKGGAGTADDLYIGEYDKPIPGKGQVLVKVKAAGVNRLDIMQRSRGASALPDHINKDVMGVEFSGIVEAVGEGVSNFKSGDEVFSLASGASYAEYNVVRSTMLMHKPSNLSFIEAASIPEVWFTAFQAVVLIGNVKKDETVLIHAGASGVGVAAIQLSRFLGAKTIFTTAGDDQKIQFLLGMKNGADHGINYKKRDFVTEIESATDGEGVDVIVDFVGKDYFPRNIKLLKRDGRLALIATLSGTVVPEVDLGPILYKRLHIEGSTLRSRSPEYQDLLTSRFVKEILPSFKEEKDASGAFKTYIYEAFPWEKVADAHKTMEANKNYGKIVLQVG